MNAFAWALLIVLGCILGSIFAWAFIIHDRLVDVRTELRRINTAYQDEIEKITGRHH